MVGYTNLMNQLGGSGSLKDMPEDHWRKTLTPEQYRVLRERGTETPFTGKYLNTKEEGVYACAACGTPLFSSDAKFESGTGWPSFTDVVEKGNVELHRDESHGMVRTEVVCATCGGHLGHLFEDAPVEMGGKRYCINSCALSFNSDNDSNSTDPA